MMRNVWVRWEGEHVAECDLRPSNEGAWSQYVPSVDVIAGVAAERAAIVKWLRERSDSFEQARDWEAMALSRGDADAIESGRHLK